MAGVILAHSALDNFCNECLSEDFTYLDGERTLDRAHIEQSMGLEKKVTRVLSAALNRPNLKSARSDLYDRAMTLKTLRDDVGHSKLTSSYAGRGAAEIDQARDQRNDL